MAELRGTNYRNFVVSNSVEGVEPKSSEDIEAEFELRGMKFESAQVKHFSEYIAEQSCDYCNDADCAAEINEEVGSIIDDSEVQLELFAKSFCAWFYQ